jgi:hypothetical protein
MVISRAAALAGEVLGLLGKSTSVIADLLRVGAEIRGRAQ